MDQSTSWTGRFHLRNAAQGAWWLSGSVLESEIEGSLVRDSLEALHCVLEQDTLASANSTSSTQEDRTSSWHDWHVMHQHKQEMQHLQKIDPFCTSASYLYWFLGLHCLQKRDHRVLKSYAHSALIIYKVEYGKFGIVLNLQ